MNYIVIYRFYDRIYMELITEKRLLNLLNNPEVDGGFGPKMKYLEAPPYQLNDYQNELRYWPEMTALIMRGNSVVVPKQEKVVIQYVLKED